MADDSRIEGAEVVSLAEVAKDMRFPVLAELEDYWHSLRGNRIVPARSEVDPRRIENALEYAFIVERIAPGMARFRLAGMHLNDLMGMEVRGMPLTAFFDPDARKRVSAAMERVFDDPAIARLSLSGEAGIGRPELEGRLLLLPLKSDFGDVSRALGCLATNGPVGRPPRRFAIRSEEIVSLATPEFAGDKRVNGWSKPKGPRPLREELGQQDGAPRSSGGSVAPGPGLSESQASYAAPGTAPRPPRSEGRPNLYIVKPDE